jgi:hypothetical protein
VGSSDIAHIVEKYDGPLFRFASRNYYTEFLAALEVAEADRVNRPVAAAAPPGAPGRAFVGSATSHRYHRPSCKWVRDIQRAKRLYFASAEAAAHRGYVPCGLCRPGRKVEREGPVSVAGE